MDSEDMPIEKTMRANINVITQTWRTKTPMLDRSEIPQALEVNPSGIQQEPGCSGSAEEQDEELKPLYREDKVEESRAASLPARATLCLKDDRLIDKGKSLYGYEFVKLWNGDYSGYTEGDSQDEADLALSNYLKRLTEGDAGEVDRLFRLSGLMRAKWDEVHDPDGRTHG
jgi:primase-polymerase (primpol)-like protein